MRMNSLFDNITTNKEHICFTRGTRFNEEQKKIYWQEVPNYPKRYWTLRGKEVWPVNRLGRPPRKNEVPQLVVVMDN